MRIHIDNSLLHRLERYLETHYPDESAGLLLGRTKNTVDADILEILTLPNRFDEEERHHRYRINPMDMLRAENTAIALDMEILGVFHSHPDHPAKPSDYDLEFALPWFKYLITRIQGGSAMETTAWQLLDDRSGFTEIQMSQRS